MSDHAPWTLGELTDRVAAALAVGYRGQPSGRVRDLPDQRAIRWYTTLGLVDRPSAMRGRTALYGRRHLLQLVAIKRLQAAGRSLAEVQAELAAASDPQLERIADLPAAAAAADPGPAATQPAPSPPGRAAAEAPPPARESRRRFWAAPTAASPAAAAGDGPATQAAVPGDGPATAAGPLPGQPTVAQLQAIQLADGVTLLVGGARPLGDADLDALQAAAGPLLAALHTRGLHRHATGRELP